MVAYVFNLIAENIKLMGFFDKLFGKGNSQNEKNEIAKTATMLNEEQYWALIAESLDYSTEQDVQEAILIKKLRRLQAADIIGFKLRTDKLLQETYSSEMWCAAYLMNGGCSDDGFDYFRAWLISKGKAVYDAAKLNPDSLVHLIDEDIECYEFESFLSIPNDAFEEQTGKDLYDFIDDNNVDVEFVPITLNWDEENPETMQAICPQLFAALM